MVILKPTHGEQSVMKAAEVFADLYERITGKQLDVVCEETGEDAVYIGNDAVNDPLMELMLEGSVAELGIRYGTDDYLIRCCMQGDRRILILAGGRGRSTLYAVYDFFERAAGCHYFWDGDVIPTADAIFLEDMEIKESPRFELRGFRYFAHRSLHRFQAEHWGYEDWKRELDFLTKRRLNFFMLRIGMDDLWQRAFPDCCDDTWTDPPGDGYNDRTPFWALKYRGELRQKVLAYAGELDLIHPEDCGTMSHWYSPAPDSFLDAEKPDFFPQADTRYSNPRTLVWDIRKQRNMDKYMKLTETAVREYNPDPEYFHTIGLGERNMMANKEVNLRLKKITLRRIAQSIRERFPNSKLLLAAWDFVGWWKGEDVAALLRELDPEKVLVLDYTAEADDETQCFLNWGMVGKFPYVFGLFHGYQPESSLRGPYARSDARLKVAAKDPYCKGMVVWPELSHSDPLMLEYLATNAWDPLKLTVEEMAERYSMHRYGDRAKQLNTLWQAALPIIQVGDWGGMTTRDANDPLAERYVTTHEVHHEMWTNMLRKFYLAYTEPYRTANLTYIPENRISNRCHYAYKLRTHKAELERAPAVLRMASECYDEDPFIARDVMDIARTVLGRYMNFMLLELVLCADEDAQKAKEIGRRFMKLMDVMADLLYLHEDYSLSATMRKMEQEHPVTPGFETTLKRNATCDYCRSYVAECCRYLYMEEAAFMIGWITTPKKNRPELDSMALFREYNERFISKPLSEMVPTGNKTFSELASAASDIIEQRKLSDY